MYPIWAGDVPSVPLGISRKFLDLNQQLFALKKCFVSPEEIMLDNTAATIQRFFRAILRRRIYVTATSSILSYKRRELTAAHRSLNAWVAQMEYADSRAQQLHIRSIGRMSKNGVRFWVKWSEKEGVITNRNNARATEQLNKSCDRRNRRIVQIWRDIATGARSWKALRDWRQSMIPIMKHELENQNVTVPLAYVDLVSAYVTIRARRSFLFNIFLAWHEKFHTKSLKETVKERNAFIFHKQRILSWTFKEWHIRVRKTKAYLATPQKWAKYIHLARTRHLSKMARIAKIVRKWHQRARNQIVLKEQKLLCQKKLERSAFIGWVSTVSHQRNLKLEVIQAWKRKIQNYNVVRFRGWRVGSLRKRTRKEVGAMFDHSHAARHQSLLAEQVFAKWRKRYADLENARADKELQRSRWRLQEAKQSTTFLSGLYARDREKISGIEAELGRVTNQFVNSENEVSQFEEVTTTWKIALHAMKMELMRLAISVQRCSTPKPQKRRRLSNEDCRDRLGNDDRYAKSTSSRISLMQTSDRVIGNWSRRNSDPDLSPDLCIVNLKPPLDENIIHLLAIDGQ
jgi:hypothetical protein